MASWTSVGHAMRRRMGAPSSHIEAKGNSMARNHMTPEEIIASAEHANSARRYVGMDMASSFEAVAPEKGTLIRKKNTQAADPMYGAKANRSNVPAGDAAASERAGAKFRVVAKMPSVDPTAAPTMGSAKIVPSIAGRQSPNFDGGMNSVR